MTDMETMEEINKLLKAAAEFKVEGMDAIYVGNKVLRGTACLLLSISNSLEALCRIEKEKLKIDHP